VKSIPRRRRLVATQFQLARSADFAELGSRVRCCKSAVIQQQATVVGAKTIGGAADRCARSCDRKNDRLFSGSFRSNNCSSSSTFRSVGDGLKYRCSDRSTGHFVLAGHRSRLDQDMLTFANRRNDRAGMCREQQHGCAGSEGISAGCVRFGGRNPIFKLGLASSGTNTPGRCSKRSRTRCKVIVDSPRGADKTILTPVFELPSWRFHCSLPTGQGPRFGSGCRWASRRRFPAT